MIKILLVDEQLLLREGLKGLLSQVPTIQIVAESGELCTVQAMVRDHRPDVILVELSTATSDPIDRLFRIKSRHPATGILVVTPHPEDEFAIRCLRAGADGYVTTSRGIDELVSAIEKVAAGGKFVTPVVGELLAKSLDPTQRSSRRLMLSDRELQVLDLIGEGKTPSQIGDELGVSVKTVSTYRTRLLHKLELENSVQLMRYAIEQKLAQRV